MKWGLTSIAQGISQNFWNYLGKNPTKCRLGSVFGPGKHGKKYLPTWPEVRGMWSWSS